MTAYSHRRNDAEFAEQWEEAESHATDLIVGRAFQRALEGDCEPILYKGVVVGHVRRFDTNLQIAVLRALRPDKFKTPGAQVNVAVKNDVFVFTEEQRHILIDYNRQWLLDHPPPAQLDGAAATDDTGRSHVSATSPATCDENTTKEDDRDSLG